MAKNTKKKSIPKTAKRSNRAVPAKKLAKRSAAKKVMVKTKKPAKKTAPNAAKKTISIPLATVMEPKVHVGGHIPAFTLHGTGGRAVSLDQLKGKNVILYFYPKDATPGCTLEGHDFTKLYPEFEATNTEILGVSKDSVKSHENFKSKENFCFDLLSDDAGELCDIFGVWREKNLYGRKYMGIERSTFLIDKDGVLRKEWRGVKVPGHADEVLNEVKTLA